MINDFANKTYVVTSKWCYPFGGGEEFLYQSMQWATKLGMRSYWLSFTTGANRDFDELFIEETEYGILIKIPDGFSKKSLESWLKLLNPDIVHHQGHLRAEFYSVCHKLKIPFMSGFHFWTGAISLSPETLNINILENYNKHKIDEELISLSKSKDCYLYVASQFVSKCIEKVTGYKIKDVIYASSSYIKNKVNKYNVLEAKYVTMINIHKMKGGNILLHLLKSCPNIPFCCIKTEYCSEQLDKEIEDEIVKRGNPLDKMLTRLDDLKYVYKNSRIMIAPSLVDETFCRTVNEAMMNGIPVISSGQGNIKSLLGDAGYIIDSISITDTLNINNLELWTDTIKNLYNDNELLIKQSQLSLKNYENHSENIAYNQFSKVVEKALHNSRSYNLMLFTPWCDQGLGIQSRNYVKLLQNSNFNCFIFAIKPYNASTCTELQKNPEEWIHPNIYYSPNDRESVKDVEITNFVNRYSIGKCLIPETCWFRVFEIAKLLRSINVKCYAVPNIEIVRKDEIFKHRYFHKIICNNLLCKNIFEKHGLTNTQYVGYGIPSIHKEKQLDNNTIRFLFIGGMNAFSRKHILEVCDAFNQVTTLIKSDKKIHLTCTVQKINLLEEEERHNILKYVDHENIEIIERHLSYTDIINLYLQSHISIQVSKHEGLGIGFYESVSIKTPVITLDTAPHNEIIKDSVNGWIIPCFYKKMTDNKDPNFDSAYFEPKVLAEKMLEIVNDPDFDTNYNTMISSLKDDYNRRLHVNKFTDTFIRALNS